MSRYPEQFRTVFAHNGFEIEVDDLNQIVRVQGVKYSFDAFSIMGNPDTQKFYQMTRFDDTVIFDSFRRLNQLDEPSDKDIVIRKL